MQMEIEGWAVVELMGHRVRAGRVRDVEVAGGKMLRVDIPTGDGKEDFVTEYYGASAIYSIRPTTEELLRDEADYRYRKTLPARPMRYADTPAIAAPGAEGEDEDDDGRPF